MPDSNSSRPASSTATRPSVTHRTRRPPVTVRDRQAYRGFGGPGERDKRAIAARRPLVCPVIMFRVSLLPELEPVTRQGPSSSDGTCTYSPAAQHRDGRQTRLYTPVAHCLFVVTQSREEPTSNVWLFHQLDVTSSTTGDPTVACRIGFHKPLCRTARGRYRRPEIGWPAVIEQYELYCLADRVFYDTLDRQDHGRGDFAASLRPVPQGWQDEPTDTWMHYAPDGSALPRQGWKIHVSSCVDDAERVCGGGRPCRPPR